MSKSLKLIFLVLVAGFLVTLSVFLVGREDSSPSVEQAAAPTAAITAAEAFMADFPALDDGDKHIAENSVRIEYAPASDAITKAVNTTLTELKDFNIIDEYSHGDTLSYQYEPNYDIEAEDLIDASAYVNFDSDSLEIDFSLLASKRMVSYREFDDIFGAVNASIGFVAFEINYDVDMSAELAVYYQKLLKSGLFKEQDCSVIVEDSDWLCYTNDGKFDYEWYANGYYVYWRKS
ncbi:MAG: hypothetical protein LBS73_04185 [Campylobacteraceae bacterium]|jgi:hypothetical protein|nr:hypothetical protein [Campylobacteraceae bacterium]